MSSSYPAAMRRLINELSKLPSIGEKSASRLAYHLLSGNKEPSLVLARAIEEAVEQIKLCRVCFFLSEEEVCSICSDAGRDFDKLCVVEKPVDVIALERCGGYRGLYHVLHGAWSPLKGVGPEHTKIDELIVRLKQDSNDVNRAAVNLEDPLSNEITELILATSTTVEGDATALYIANYASELGVAVTRIAQGLPKGGELEYADEMTLNLSFRGRREL